MKKLMFAAAAIMAGVAVADVTSANVVGYQNLDVAKKADGGVTYLVNTIPPVGADLETEVKLKDFKVVSPAGGLQDDTSVYMTTYTSQGKRDGEFIYLDEAIYEDFYAEEPGWYTAESVSNYEPESADDEIIEFGRGVIIKSNCGAMINCAGEVIKKGPTFDIAKKADGGVTYTGNATPTRHDLADFAIISPKGGLVDDTSVYMTTYTSQGKRDGEFIYLDDAIYEDFYAEEPGWYTAESVSNYEPESAGEESIDAGRMFIIKSNCGAQIVMPDGY